MEVKGRILLICSESKFKELLSISLEMKGYEIASAASENLIMDQCALSEFDVIVADMDVPFSNQLELIQKVHAVKPSTHLIFLTCYPVDWQPRNGDSIAQRLERHGLLNERVKVVTKPFPLADFFNMIKNMCRKRVCWVPSPDQDLLVRIREN